MNGLVRAKGVDVDDDKVVGVGADDDKVVGVDEPSSFLYFLKDGSFMGEDFSIIDITFI